MSSVLSPATAKPAPSVVHWDKEMLEAFNQIKVCLVQVCVLTVPCHDDRFVLHTDASGSGIGATLNVVKGGGGETCCIFFETAAGSPAPL